MPKRSNRSVEAKCPKCGLRVRVSAPEQVLLDPPTRCQHVLQPPSILSQDSNAGTCELHTPFVYFESRGERRIVLAGSYRHRLVLEP